VPGNQIFPSPCFCRRDVRRVRPPLFFERTLLQLFLTPSLDVQETILPPCRARFIPNVPLYSRFKLKRTYAPLLRPLFPSALFIFCSASDIPLLLSLDVKPSFDNFFIDFRVPDRPLLCFCLFFFLRTIHHGARTCV